MPLPLHIFRTGPPQMPLKEFDLHFEHKADERQFVGGPRLAPIRLTVHHFPAVSSWAIRRWSSATRAMSASTVARRAVTCGPRSAVVGDGPGTAGPGVIGGLWIVDGSTGPTFSHPNPVYRHQIAPTPSVYGLPCQISSSLPHPALLASPLITTGRQPVVSGVNA